MATFNPTVIERGLNALFVRGMRELNKARSLSPGIMAAVLNSLSTGAYEKMGWVGSMPAVKQWLGTKQPKDYASYDYTIKNLDWESSVPINQNDIDDDQTGSLALFAAMLADRIMKHPEKLMIDLMINGTTNLAYDGVAFYSDVSGARTIDNLLAGTGSTTIALLAADLTAARIAMAKFDDDNDEILNIRGNQIVCPIALEDNFNRIVLSDDDPTSSVDGTFNPYKGIQVVGDARLDADDATDWYLNATGEVMKPFVMQMRQKGKSSMEKTPLTKTWVYSADYRGNGGYGDPRLSIKTVNT